ncbi:MAG TPA: Fic family protein [Pontibacter sp.]
MRKIEEAPNWQETLFDKGVKLFLNPDFKELIHSINEKYYYWDKVKYQKLPEGATHEELWTGLKFSRSMDAKTVSFGRYTFTYNKTNFIESSLHHFDLNMGGNLGSKGLVPEDDKKRYLVSSVMEEAIASSQIEGAVTTRKEAKEMLRKRRKPRTKSEQMIINNYNTINHILENQSEKLTIERLLEVHRLIANQTMDDDGDEGKFRETDDVNVVDAIDGEIVHSPPSHQEIPQLMNELCAFFNEDNTSKFIHPIIKGCIIHFMIGFIHPFTDGNGRTARALFYWYLLSKGYWLTEYLSISRLIIRSKAQYARAYVYSEIDDNDLTYFINYKLKTMTLAYESLKEYINRKISEKKQLTEFQKIEGINERQALIIKWAYEEPDLLLTIKEVETRFNISNETARSDLRGLAEHGYLDEILLHGRKKAYSKGGKFEELIRKDSKEYKTVLKMLRTFVS